MPTGSCDGDSPLGWVAHWLSAPHDSSKARGVIAGSGRGTSSAAGSAWARGRTASQTGRGYTQRLSLSGSCLQGKFLAEGLLDIGGNMLYPWIGRFILAFPQYEIRTLVPLGLQSVRKRLSMIVPLGLWFALQLVNGLGEIGAQAVGSGWEPSVRTLVGLTPGLCSSSCLLKPHAVITASSGE